MSTPVLTIGELQPERATVAINRNAPDGWWQRFKYRHFDVLLRWLPVRFAQSTEQYELRRPGEFGLRELQRISAMQQEVRGLQGDLSPAAAQRMAQLLRRLTGMLLDAPADVMDSLSPVQHIQVLQVFPTAVTGKTPTTAATENPPTSDASSPASAGSIRATAGRTG